MKRKEEREGTIAAGAEVHHPLSERDRATVAAMRVEAAPFKGKMSDPSARGAFDAVMEHTSEPARVVTYEDAVLGGVNGLWCVPHGSRPTTAILYLHGGAYLLGSARAYRHFVGQFAARTSTRAFIADYRLAPEHPFPAALEDARAAYRAIVATGVQQVAIVGDSAGGGLALALLSALQSDAERGVAPSAAVVMSPWTDLALTGASMDERADDDPLVTKEMLRVASASYLGEHDPRDPRASPLYVNFTGRCLPPMQLHVGTSEVLLDDTRRYAARAHAAGVDVTAHVWDGMPHVFPSSVGALDAAALSLDLMAGFLLAYLGERPGCTPASEEAR